MALAPEDEELISEHLTEAEVFVKYGLADRAAEQLTAIVEKYPWHILSRQRLRDVYLEEGNRARAANEAAALAKILSERGDRAGAAAALQEARSIDAACPAIQQVEALLKGEAAPATARTAPVRRAVERPAEEGEFVIEEEEEEAVEEAVSAPSGPPEEDLNEFDFYLSQKMIAEAAAVLSRLEASFGPHPGLEMRREQLGSAGVEALDVDQVSEVEEEGAGAGSPSVPEIEIQAESPVEPPAPEEEAVPVAEVNADTSAPPSSQAGASAGASDFFDLASELDASLFSAQEAGDEEAVLAGIEASPEGHSLDEIVSAFKKGIEQQVDSEDFETHYNLGIAYKEMGLIEEGIAEFQFASKDPRLLADCCSMLGICFKEKGMLPLAVKWYQKGLESLSGAGTNDEERLSGVRYDLAEVLEQMGEYRQAMNLFVEVYGTDSRYRDVSARIKELEKRLSS
jgi:tetratricopeptide (TPR) repeat protein